MKVLHFVNNFSQPTETFIKRYVQKSHKFAECGVAAFNMINVAEGFDGIALFKIEDSVYTRKTIAGATRFITEFISKERKWYKQLQDILELFKPDVIHCHFGVNGITWMDFARKAGINIPFVTSFYGYDASSLPFTDKHYRKKLDELWVSGNAFFAEGPEMINKLIKLGCEKSKCLVNPLLIPVDDYPTKTHYRQPGDKVKFLFIGRFIEKKGFHIFLNAVGLLQKEIPDFFIDIIGSGPYQSVYEETISRYGLNEKINWLGLKTHAEVIGMMKEYDFLVHPSLTANDNDSEGGAPTIIIEAQAAGLPVITSNHADIPFVMGYQDFIANENDLNSLVAAIKNMVNCENIAQYAMEGMVKVRGLHDLQQNTSYEVNFKKLISR